MRPSFLSNAAVDRVGLVLDRIYVVWSIPCRCKTCTATIHKYTWTATSKYSAVRYYPERLRLLFCKCCIDPLLWCVARIVFCASCIFGLVLNRKELSFGQISISKIHFTKASFNNRTLKVMVMVHLFKNHHVVSNNQPPAPKDHSPTDTRPHPWSLTWNLKINLWKRRLL